MVIFCVCLEDRTNKIYCQMGCCKVEERDQKLFHSLKLRQGRLRKEEIWG